MNQPHVAQWSHDRRASTVRFTPDDGVLWSTIAPIAAECVVQTSGKAGRYAAACHVVGTLAQGV